MLMMKDCLNPKGVWAMGADVDQAAVDWSSAEDANLKDIFNVWNILSFFKVIATVDPRDGCGILATSRACRILDDAKIR
jgi:hypothetical protein